MSHDPTSFNHARFVRIPNLLIERLLKTRLTSVQWRILLWTIRHTHGWNRRTTPFSWYRIAKDLSLDRGGVVRAGKRLLLSGVLAVEDGRLGVKTAIDQRPVPQNYAQSDDSDPPMTAVIADARQRKRGRPSSVFRRAKDRCKDIKDIRIPFATLQRPTAQTLYHSAGAAKPVPGKYDSIAER